MRWLGIIVVWLLGAGSAAAACPPELLARLLDQGFSREDVLQVCGGGQDGQAQPAPAEPADQGGLPAWLAGDWQVTQTVEATNAPGWGQPPLSWLWRIEVGAGGTLTVASVQDPHLAGTGMSSVTPSEVRDVRVSGGRLSFTTRENFANYKIITTAYEFDLSGEPDFVTGRWRSRDTGAFGLPPMEQSGAIQMVKMR